MAVATIDDAVLADPLWRPAPDRRPVRVYLRTVRPGVALEVAWKASGWEVELVKGRNRVPLGPVGTPEVLADVVRVLERRP